MDSLYVRKGLAPGVDSTTGGKTPVGIPVGGQVCDNCRKTSCVTGLCGGVVNTTRGSERGLVSRDGMFGTHVKCIIIGLVNNSLTRDGWVSKIPSEFLYG